MTRKTLGLCITCIAIGAIGGVLAMKNKEKIKPLAADLLAKSIQLKEKAMSCAARAKEHADDIVAEAKHINQKPAASRKAK